MGTTQSLVSVDALEEFRVSSSTYSAEFGRNPGGQFSFLTRSGTNTFHGSLFDYLRNNVFDANDWFNDYYGIAQPALRQNDFGGTVGGPLRIPRLYDGKDKTFFFISYEGLRLVLPTAATTQYVPSLSLRTQAPDPVRSILNAFPMPTGAELQIQCSVAANNCPPGSPTGMLVPSGLAPFIGSYSLPSKVDAISIRLDHKFSSKLSAFFRFADTPTSSETRPQSLSTLVNASFLTRTYTLGVTTVLNRRFSNELRLGYASSASRSDGSIDSYGGAVPTNLGAEFGIPSAYQSPTVLPFLSFSGIGSTSIETTTAVSQLHQWNVIDTANMSFGHHSLRIGFDERHLVSPLLPPSLTLAPYFFSDQALLGDQSDLLVIQKHVAATPAFNQFAAFAQDTWQVARGVTLSLGIRWEVDPPPSAAHGNLPYIVLRRLQQSFNAQPRTARNTVVEDFLV